MRRGKKRIVISLLALILAFVTMPLNSLATEVKTTLEKNDLSDVFTDTVSGNEFISEDYMEDRDIQVLMTDDNSGEDTDNLLKTGDTIYFGSYPQNQVKDEDTINILNQQPIDSNNNVIYKGNKYKKYKLNFYQYEPILWRVLSADNSKILIVADKTIDAQAYNKDNVSITWEKCTLRSWLNGTFMNEAFSINEQSSIQLTSLVNAKNPYWSITNAGGGDTR